ncbi:MAG TPA: ZIP family metal transporter [Candidatus Avichristensenella intestinipullorum]|uniref:ZIP family metal transporter n=1 Tax=Candidatus Avichristensenella intestinipullorum TaxID=2840693 RepID=A0A9D1CI49_9FIRM|nr:ZIP family metal transporter [Candidatus Avichristensenella intestinipullorum]
MQLALITALGVGGATVLGAALGFCFKRIPHRYNDALLSFAAGVMLAAAIMGLILPAVELGGRHGVWMAALGVFVGALFLTFADRLIPHLHSLAGMEREAHGRNRELDRILLFILAIAIHNFPEGVAAGVASGQEDIGNAVSVGVGIMLQNIPEGMIVISPLLLAGVSRGRAFLIASFTGVIEVFGTFLGYFAVSIVSTILPFALAFAGGTMLYVIGDEMIPETHSHGYERLATYSLLAGFVLMLVLDAYLG